MNIHAVLEMGAIVANDEALDVLFAYNDETRELIMFQGDTSGEYDISDTRKDVPDEDEAIEEAVEDMMDAPD